MRFETPHQIALAIGAGVAVLAGILLYGAAFIVDALIPVWAIALAAAAIFGTAYGIAWWTIENFLHAKIKLLYRTIHSPETLENKYQSALRSSDSLSEVQKEVEEWAVDKQSEIQRLKEQAKFRRDFIGNLAHELKTPIFNMQGYLLTLLEGGLEDPKINYDYLTRADKNLERLIALIEDLDSISKLEAGREMLKPERFNLIELVEEVFHLLELRAADKNIELRFNKKYEKPIWVKADRGKVQQVFSNLVLNAINYGKYDGYCEVRFLDMQQNILVEVADDGIGVHPEDLPRLFERFYRVDKSRARNQGGTGLGLAIVKHIVESHGQNISVRSVLDKGTTFSFTLEKTK